METFKSPFFIMLYLAVFVLVVWQYKRLYKMSETLFNIKNTAYLRSALVSALLGLVGCGLGSILLVLLGIDLANIAINQLWIVAIILMFIQPRFLCFAYAAGVLSLAHLIIGYPELSIPQLMGLVAALHMVESLLILLNGHLSPVPIYVHKHDYVRGGFNLQKFWPIPLVALVSINSVYNTGGLNMPDWWPLLKDYSQFSSNQMYSLIPVLAVLGYGDITTTRTPSQKTRRSAWHLFLFSVLLMILAILASRWYILVWAVALFSPLGHELVIWLGIREENNRQPIYIMPVAGVMILDVVPGSPAAKCGLKSRDIIVSINGEPVGNYNTLNELLKYSPSFLRLKIQRGAKTLKLTFNSSAESNTGIIPVPAGQSDKYLIMSQDSIFAWGRGLWRRLKAKL